MFCSRWCWFKISGVRDIYSKITVIHWRKSTGRGLKFEITESSIYQGFEIKGLPCTSFGELKISDIAPMNCSVFSTE